MIVDETAPKMTTRRAVARWISIIIHPIVYPLVTLAIIIDVATSGNLSLSFRFLLLAIALTSLPVTLLVGYQVARGHWTDLDVSVRKQRYFLYPFGLAGLILLALAFKWLGAPAVAVKAAVASVVANLADGVINFWYKVSAHTTTAAVCATLPHDHRPRARRPLDSRGGRGRLVACRAWPAYPRPGGPGPRCRLWQRSRHLRPWWPLLIA